jgi:hypothetical protein
MYRIQNPDREEILISWRRILYTAFVEEALGSIIIIVIIITIIITHFMQDI